MFPRRIWESHFRNWSQRDGLPFALYVKPTLSWWPQHTQVARLGLVKGQDLEDLAAPQQFDAIHGLRDAAGQMLQWHLDPQLAGQFGPGMDAEPFGAASNGPTSRGQWKKNKGQIGGGSL